MKNWLKKCSVALLVFSMIGTTMPVYAADAPAAETQTTTEYQTEEQKSEVQAEEPQQQEEQPTEGEQTTEEQQSVSENEQGEAVVQEQEEAPEQEEPQQEVQTEECRMNYAYVESPYLQTPETQRIVVSWGTEDEYIEQMVLHVRKDDDTWEDWCISRSEGNLYLFEKYYEDEYQSGTYEVVSISVTENGETTDYAFADLGTEAKFGVNQEYDGIDELQPIDEEQEEAEAEDAVGISVSTLNEDGTIEEQNSIEDALQAAQTDILASTPTMMSLDDDSGISTQAARSGKIVVALDPGHDDRDNGASDYNLNEEVLTLKIANYCKEELLKYSGVEVYMTRTTAACPYPSETPIAGCIAARADAAAKAGAKIFVSIHINAATSTAKGAEVIFPNENWKQNIGVEGEKLAKQILDELVSLGLTKRRIYCQTETDPEITYPDGSMRDWFAVQRETKRNGMPGIIVEHAFITNKDDVNNFLNNEAGLKRLGVADATGIANYLGLSKEKVEWKTVNGKKYCYVNNQKITGERQIGGYWYYFDGNGVMQTGFVNLGSKTVYYNSDGQMQYGEQKINNAWYYFDTITGARITGFYNLPGKTVYYGSDGQMRYGEQKINNAWYCFDTITGARVTGFYNLSGKIYYYGIDGKKRFGEQRINDAWYCFDTSTGKMITGFYDLPGKVVYYGADGKMLYGEQKIGNCYYYFDPTFGSMYVGWKTVNKKSRYYQENGCCTIGEYKIDDKWYYFDKNGIMQTGFVDLPEKTVYYNENGVMEYGEQKINDAWYYFDMITGKMATGFCELPEKWVYYGSNGKMLYGEQKIGNYYYYFDTVFGSMYSGWKTVNGKTRYYQSNGQSKIGEYCENGRWYYFDKNGVMQKGFVQLPGKTVYYNGSGVMQYGEQKISDAWYYFDTITGKMATGFYNLPGKTVYYGTDGKMLYKEQKIGNYYYYFDAVTGAMVKNTTINGHYYDNTGKRVEKQQEASHLIVNTSTTNVTQMVQFYKNTGETYPTEKLKKGGAESIEKFASIYYEEATAEGVDPAVAWCQSMKETGWLQFGGQVKIEQFNFAGLGATDNGASGADFSKYGENGVRMGVRAQIQHLKAYAVSGLTEKDLKYTCVDPRFRLVNKGSAKYVEWLGTHENPIGAGWATGVEYGQGIIKLMNQLEK